jgi:hypothetical protein
MLRHVTSIKVLILANRFKGKGRVMSAAEIADTFSLRTLGPEFPWFVQPICFISPLDEEFEVPLMNGLNWLLASSFKNLHELANARKSVDYMTFSQVSFHQNLQNDML